MNLERENTNLQQKLAFTQQEHAKTLKSLQHEISNLQRKCADLTFELAMSSGSSVPCYIAKDAQQQTETMAERVQESSTHNSPCSSPQSESLMVLDLKQQLMLLEMEKNYALQRKAKTIRLLNVQLEAKEQVISDLTNELHLWKLRSGGQVSTPTPTPPSGDAKRAAVTAAAFRLRGATPPELPPLELAKAPQPDPAPFLVDRDRSGLGPGLASDDLHVAALTDAKFTRPIPPIAARRTHSVHRRDRTAAPPPDAH